MNPSQTDWNKHRCDHCDKDYYATQEELNLEGMDNVQRLIAVDKGPKTNFRCPDCGHVGMPYKILNRKVDAFKNINGTTMIFILALGYYLNGKWIHPLLMYLFDLHENQSDVATWLVVSPLITGGMIWLLSVFTSKKVHQSK